MAPGRVAAQIRYNSKRAPCRDCPDAAKIMMAAPAGDLPAGRYLTGACGGCRVPGQRAVGPVLAMFLRSQSAGIVLLPARGLNFSDAQN